MRSRRTHRSSYSGCHSKSCAKEQKICPFHILYKSRKLEIQAILVNYVMKDLHFSDVPGTIQFTGERDIRKKLTRLQAFAEFRKLLFS